MNNRVVVTGLGLLTPCGKGWESYWHALLEGVSHIGPISSFSLNGFESKLGGEIRDFAPAEFIKQRKSIKLMSRDIQLAVAASQMAVEDSRLDLNAAGKELFGVCLGSGIINNDLDELGAGIREGIEEGRFSMSRFAGSGIGALFPLWFLKYLPNMPACHVSIAHGFKGPANTITTSSAASLQAIGEASRIIERGDALGMIAGGSDSKLNAIGLSRLHMLGLLSKKNGNGSSYAPFDETHDGLVPAEAAGIAVLESLEHAERRGAKVYGEITGYGSSAQPFSLFEKTREGAAAKVLAMQSALCDAGLGIEDVDVLIADGSGIPAADIEEAEAVKDLFGSRLNHMAVTSLKPVTGHSLYASGGVELAAALRIAGEERVPAVANLKTPHAGCRLPFILGKPLTKPVKTVLINSFGLGGQNASLVLTSGKRS